MPASHALLDASSVGLVRQPAADASGEAGVSLRCSRKRSVRSPKSGRKSDAQTQAAANGKANIVDVVTAVAETEVAIDAVVAVRDHVIAAYEDIMKMPI